MTKTPAKEPKERVCFDPQVAAQVLMDAKVLGSDSKAAAKWGITERTVRRYRKRLHSAGEPELSAEVLRLERDVLHGWGEERLKTLNAAMQRAQVLIPACDSLSELGAFVERVGGLDMVMKAFPESSEGARTPTEGATSAEAAGGSGQGSGFGEDD